MPAKKIFPYENKMLILLTFTFGFVLFDRMALNFLVPFFDKELGLNNTQIGLLASLLALAWAISGYAIGTLSDKTGKRKQYLIISVAIFSACSFISGLAASFAFLLVARIIMGFSEGPVLPLAHSIMVSASAEKRRGFNMGFMQSFGSNLLGTMLAPVILVALATNYGWRNAFFIAGVPGLILATLGFFMIKEIPVFVKEKKQKANVADLFKYRNVWVAIILSGCMMTWMFAQITFMPKFLIAIKHFSEEDMGKTMAAYGLGSIIWGAVVPALSDKLGRKPVVIFFFLMSMIMPLSVVYAGDTFSAVAPLVILGATTMGCFPIVLATIPSETVPRQFLAQTLGMIMGIGELIGGFAAPAIAGWSADKFGLQAPFLIAAGAVLLAGFIGFLLIETGPVKLRNKGALATIQTV
ncbi:MFS transporter [Panacibacter ginsenosidivorans]|uniref:MFS transporter n=1 Tax=Panacibacter ginsenosidivorans TaxID=1813871 RepID=A0A5B8V5U1_9BACT|nr:MFS transporter [Panacibacter ginsenosidivorans]QEC66847.1 MFS transporter [Panacibacter ginsenosidivorans]